MVLVWRRHEMERLAADDILIWRKDHVMNIMHSMRCSFAVRRPVRSLLGKVRSSCRLHVDLARSAAVWRRRHHRRSAGDHEYIYASLGKNMPTFRLTETVRPWQTMRYRSGDRRSGVRPRREHQARDVHSHSRLVTDENAALMDLNLDG